MSQHPHAALAAKFFGAIEAGDEAAVASCYADHAVIWHNDDGKAQAKAENLEVLKGFIGFTRSRAYTERRLLTHGAGFAQQHRLVAETHNGHVLTMDVSLFCVVENGVIVRLDEYMDPAPVQAWIKAATA